MAPLAATTPAPAPVSPAAPPSAPAGAASTRGGQYVDGVYVANTDYLLSYPRNIYRMLTSPSRFDRGDWINVVLVAGIGGALLIVDKPWVPWVAYTVATGTALSRVDDNKHWFSDVFVAGAVGLFVGKMVTRYSPFMARNNITLLPFSEDGARGVEVAFKL